MEMFLLIIRLGLAAIFLVAGIGKLLDPAGSEKAVEAFGVPKSLAKPVAIFLPIAEIVFAALLLFTLTSWFGAVGASLLLLIFIAGMLWQMKQGNAPDCHCFGQIHSEPVNAKSLTRNIIFAVLACFLVFKGRGNQGLAISDLADNNADAMQIILGVIILGLMVVLLSYLAKVRENQSEILRRLDVLEIVGGEGKLHERENLGDPNEGLPIGSPLPDFAMPTADGRVITRDEILAKKKPILFFNVSPTCRPCEALLPEIAKWESELSNKISFVFTSKGSKSDNLLKFQSDLDRDILIQDDKELAELLEILWTPTVLFVNKSGMVASSPAAGDVAIRELIEKIKIENLDDELVYVSKESENGKEPKIGENIPSFSLEDLSGKEVSTNDLQGKKTLVTFWSMSCSHCDEMIEELRNWDKVKGKDEPNLVVFSDGNIEEHERLELNSPIVIDEGYKVSDKLGMFGTPSAVLINENGKIVSETAIGAGQIWALIGRRM